MKVYKLISGNTIESQLNSIDIMLQRLMRRVHKTVLMITPPSVISNYEAVLPPDGVVFRTIFPCDGKIEALSMYMTTEPGKRQQTSIYILNGATQKVYSSSIVDPIHVKVGDMAAVKVDGEVSNIWTSLLFNGDWHKGEKETIAIEQLEKIVEDFSKGE